MKTAYLTLVSSLHLYGILLLQPTDAAAQNGTYMKRLDHGAYSAISLEKLDNNQVTAEIFTWWNTPSAQMGYFSGTGTLKNNSCVLKSDDDPDCKVTISLIDGKMKSLFSDCAPSHLTEDFNGLYRKLTNATVGDYLVTVPKAFFHDKPDAKSKRKAFVLKGDMVSTDMQRIMASNETWLRVYFSNKLGKQTEGFLRLSELKKKSS